MGTSSLKLKRDKCKTIWLDEWQYTNNNMLFYLHQIWIVHGTSFHIHDNLFRSKLFCLDRRYCFDVNIGNSVFDIGTQFVNDCNSSHVHVKCACQSKPTYNWPQNGVEKAKTVYMYTYFCIAYSKVYILEPGLKSIVRESAGISGHKIV